MPKPKFVKITKDGLEGEVVKSALPAWERNGWTAVDDESSEVEPHTQDVPQTELATDKPADKPQKPRPETIKE